MFENLNLKSLDEEIFEGWLESGRASKIRFEYLVVLWDESQKEYRPIYLHNRSEMNAYADDPSRVGDVFIAAYDLYTESKVR